MNEMIPNEFRHKQVNFKIIKHGAKALLLEAEADFYDCKSLEVWKIKQQPERMIFGKIYPPSYRKPGNDDYGIWAYQYLQKRYSSEAAMIERALWRFNQIENAQ